MMAFGIDRLRQADVRAIYAHIKDGNMASIRTCASLGFRAVSRGSYISSYGEPRRSGSEYVILPDDRAGGAIDNG